MTDDSIIRLGQEQKSGPFVNCSRHGPKQTLEQARVALPGEKWLDIGCAACCIEAMSEFMKEWKIAHDIRWEKDAK